MRAKVLTGEPKKIIMKMKPKYPMWHRYLYRGQYNHWPLLPSALRIKEGKMKIEEFRTIVTNKIDQDNLYEENRLGKISEKWGEDIYYKYIEWRVINRFIHIADDAGVHLPGDGYPLRRIIERIRPIEKIDNPCFIKFLQRWPEIPPFYPIIILAQHYGLPTRFLDWTEHPYVALYMAASNFEFDKKEEKKKYIWLYRLDTKAAVIKKHILIIPEIQGSLNPNLSAQKGICTLYTEHKIDGSKYDGYEKIRKIKSALKIIKIERKKATEILEHLKTFWISRDTLFPSLRGIADSIKERAEYLRNM